jgi:hypothetical protein
MKDLFNLFVAADTRYHFFYITLEKIVSKGYHIVILNMIMVNMAILYYRLLAYMVKSFMITGETIF